MVPLQQKHTMNVEERRETVLTDCCIPFFDFCKTTVSYLSTSWQSVEQGRRLMSNIQIICRCGKNADHISCYMNETMYSNCDHVHILNL